MRLSLKFPCPIYICMVSQKHIWPLVPCRGRFRAVGVETASVALLLALCYPSAFEAAVAQWSSGFKWPTGERMNERRWSQLGLRQVPVYARPQGAGGVTEDNIEQCFKMHISTLDIKCQNHLSINKSIKSNNGMYCFHELRRLLTKLELSF